MPKNIFKAEYFRDPKNFFGINVTTVKSELGPHWHPNADEFDYFLEGTATVTIVEPAAKAGGKSTVFEVSPGDVIVIPQGYAHSYVVTPGNPPLKFLAVFNNSAFQVIDSHQVADSVHPSSS